MIYLITYQNVKLASMQMTVIICAGKTAEEVQISLQHDLNCALEWFKVNRLHLNVKKTKWNLIGTYQKIGKATEISITVNGEQLERVDGYKYLGMIFDKNLNWHNHIDKMCATISRRLGTLTKNQVLYTKCNFTNAL